MSGHAVVADLSRQPECLTEITKRVKGFGIGHITVQLERDGECVGCEEPRAKS